MFTRKTPEVATAMKAVQALNQDGTWFNGTVHCIDARTRKVTHALTQVRRVLECEPQHQLLADARTLEIQLEGLNELRDVLLSQTSQREHGTDPGEKAPVTREARKFVAVHLGEFLNDTDIAPLARAGDAAEVGYRAERYARENTLSESQADAAAITGHFRRSAEHSVRRHQQGRTAAAPTSPRPVDDEALFL